MSAGRRVGFGLLGAIAGTALGGGAGLLGGLGYTQLAATSSFEGYSGFVVAYWILGGGLFGLIAGIVAGVRLGK